MKEDIVTKRTTLKALRLKGFKSFARTTTVLFSPGISAIVGPNGCGKSNVVDAIKWVLGEQGYKPLRSKTAEDLIFSGTDRFSPASMAEVSIILEQEGNPSSAEFMLTRRIFRSGETGYLINKRPCRLKDIRETLLNLGFGLKSYGIIDQGQVTELIEFSPLEKRRLLEEAAGITKYREKKEETLRKLEDTKQNLVRLEDILKEVETQVRRLAQQAKRAKEYLELKDKLRQIEISLLLQRYKSKKEAWERRQKEATQLREENSALLSRHASLSQQLKEVKYQVFNLQEQLKTKEKSLWETRTKLKELELKQKGLDEKEEAAKKRKKQLEEHCKRLEVEKEEIKKQRAKVEKELVQLESQLKTLKEEGEGVKTIVAELENILKENGRILKEKKQAQDKIKQRLIRTETEIEHLQRQKRRLEEDKKGIAEKLRQAKEKALKTEEELKKISTKLGVLEERINELTAKKKEAEEAYEGILERHRRWQRAVLNMEEILIRRRSQLKTVEQWLKAHQPREKLKGALGQVMDILAEAKGYEDAVEAVLRFKVNDGWLIPDLETGLRLLKVNKVQTLVPVELKIETYPLNTPLGTPLLEKIRFKPGYEEVGKRLFAQVVLVEKLEAKLLNYAGYLFVTPMGEILTKEGILHKEQMQGVLKEYLEKQQKKTWLKSTISVLETKLPQVKTISERLKRQLKQQEAFVKEAEREIKRLEKERQRLKGEEIRQREFLKYTLLQKEEIEKRQVKIEDEWIRLEQQQTEREKERQVLREQNGQLREELRRLREKLEKVERLRNEKKEFLSRYQWQQQEGEKKRVFLRKERQRLERREGECERELKQGLKETEELTVEIKRAFQERETIKRDLVVCKEKLEEIEGIIELRKRELEVSLKGKKDLERQIESLEREITQKRERLQVLEREMEGLQAEANLFKERLLKEYELSADNETPPFVLSEKELEEKRLEVNLRLEKLGQVNLGAIEEYEEVKERYEFLKAQREDLRASIRDLQKAIRTIDQTSAKLFLSTLEKANQEFKRLLQFIFGEARGEIVLLDPAHPLTSGVDFKVQLPGKRVRHHLFSMGERSLISLIFLFGLYFIKPSPFCILDEVDAGLDERNVERFCNLLKQLKDTMQLIVITHHRRVMEAADQLIGVTMEQKGVSSIVSISLEGGDKNVQVV